MLTENHHLTDNFLIQIDMVKVSFQKPIATSTRPPHTNTLKVHQPLSVSLFAIQCKKDFSRSNNISYT